MEEDQTVYSKDWLQMRGAEFLVTLREKCKLLQSTLEEVIHGVETLLEDYSLVVMVSTLPIHHF